MNIRVTLDGGKKVTAHLPDNKTVPTDQSLKDGGTDSAPTPYDYFLASIATCAGVYVADFCSHRSIPTENITLSQSAEFTVDGNGKRHLVDVALTIDLPADFPEKYRTAIIKVAELCAVKRAILTPPRFEVAVRPDHDISRPTEQTSVGA